MVFFCLSWSALKPAVRDHTIESPPPVGKKRRKAALKLRDQDTDAMIRAYAE